MQYASGSRISACPTTVSTNFQQVGGCYMQPFFIRSARRILSEGVGAALANGVVGKDYRAALCRWEDDLFRRFPRGHGIIAQREATSLIETIFEACGRKIPQLLFVRGFDDPLIGGFADVERNCIVIEEGCLYRFLVLHESAHMLVPADRRHGPVFTYVLQALYRAFIGVPEHAVRELLLHHGLPCYTDLPGDGAIPIAA
jgi:hypothetical protein